MEGLESRVKGLLIWVCYTEAMGVEKVVWKPRVKGVPGELWVRGKWDEKLFKNCVAVVGSRRMTEYGKRVVEKLVPRLVQEGRTIVSGFMYGVDLAAHQTTIECGGKTVAVLGWGIHYPMTSDQTSMTKKITENGGLVLSQWERQEPTLWTFPARNRIVAGVTTEIFVVEAAAKSGALITAEMGRELGRKIWAVPGPVTSKVSMGTNMLIKTGKAEMWVPESGRTGELKSIGNRGDLYTLLQNEVLTVDEIVRRTGRSADDIGSEVTMMILRGDVVERDGKYYLAND